MIDPARKPAQAPPTKPVAKPTTTRGLIKRALSVLLGGGVTCRTLKKTCIPGVLWTSFAWTAAKSVQTTSNPFTGARKSGTD